MNLNQWKKASEQLLVHLQRSGIQRLPTPQPTLPPAIAAWPTEHASGTVESGLLNRTQIAPAAVTKQVTPVTQTTQVDDRKTERAQGLDVVLDRGATSHRALEFFPWTTPTLGPEERARGLSSLAQEVAACRKCSDIVCRRQRTVFGVGPLQPRLVMFGEAPGAEEDRTGEPFVGPAGQLLDKILVASGLSRDQVYIMNSLKCRPPGNRTPTDSEIENCKPFFERQLEILQPEYIVCWGAVAAKAVLGMADSIGRLRGRFYAYKSAKVMVTYHPSYLLRTPEAKRLTWEDMKMLMRELGTPNPGSP